MEMTSEKNRITGRRVFGGRRIAVLYKLPYATAFYMQEFNCFAPTSCKCRQEAYEKAERERRL